MYLEYVQGLQINFIKTKKDVDENYLQQILLKYIFP